jgi:hypothetical protein
MTCESKIGADGRPTQYTTGIGNAICERLFAGESLRAICADEGMPAKPTVSEWLARYPEFRKEYQWTLADKAEVLAGETRKIADDAEHDYVEMARANGKVVTVFDRYNLARCRLRCDVRWCAPAGAERLWVARATRLQCS